MTENNSTKLQVKKLAPGDLAAFCFQLSLTLKAGMPLFEGLSALSSKSGDGGGVRISSLLGKAIDSMADWIEEGDTLFSAMTRAGIFPEYSLKMVELGESTGKLQNVLESLGDYYEKEQFLKVKIRNSLMYPVFLFVIMSIVIVLLVGRVFPIFNDILESMGSSLSDAEKAVASFSNSLLVGEYTMYIVLGISALVVLVFLFTCTKAGKNFMTRLGESFPLTKNISKKISASRFSNAISMTLSSGMDMDSVMRFAVSLVDTRANNKKLQNCVEEIKAGARFSESVGKLGFFVPMHMKFIEIGDRTGSLDSVMKKISDVCSEEADNAISSATSIIEPLLVGILSTVIGVVLISVIIPLVQVMSNIA